MIQFIEKTLGESDKKGLPELLSMIEELPWSKVQRIGEYLGIPPQLLMNNLSREYLEAKHGQVWDASELQRDFDVLGFMAPLVVATRKSDGTKGSLMFQGSPQCYFGWSPE